MTPSPSDAVAFETEEVTVRYAGVCANDAVSVVAGAGEIVGLIGPNGAGKTTFVDAVSGFAPCSGRVRVGGRGLDGAPPHRRARAGLARTWQSLELFPDLTVRENLQVAEDSLSWRSVVSDLVRPGRSKDHTRTGPVLELLELTAVAEQLPKQLPLGLRKLVGVARAIVTAPTVVLLDEPAAGLDPDESAQLAGTLRKVAAEGVALVLIDHDMELVLGLCDRVYVLDMGRVIAEGPPDEVRRDPLVVAAYLGTEAEP